MRWQKNEQIAAIPMRIIGPVRIKSQEVDEDISIPLATFETPLWASTHRGARVCHQAGGIHAAIIDERMTRSVLLEAQNVKAALNAFENITKHKSEWASLVEKTSNYA